MTVADLKDQGDHLVLETLEQSLPEYIHRTTWWVNISSWAAQTLERQQCLYCGTHFGREAQAQSVEQQPALRMQCSTQQSTCSVAHSRAQAWKECHQARWHLELQHFSYIRL